MNQWVDIAGRRVGPGFPCYIVAEIGSNWVDFQTASNLIRAAKEAGADAVKLQTYKPETMTINSPRYIVNESVYKGTLWDLYKDTAMPWEWQPKLKALADKIGVTLFSTPFDKTAVDFLENMGVPCFKIASAELCDIPLIEYAAGKNKPMILSTGMAYKYEIREAIDACLRAGNNQIAILKCTSAYPAKPEDMNLIRINPKAYDVYLAYGTDCESLGYPMGLSDHTMGYTAAIMAVAYGACLIEKHIMIGYPETPDSFFSLPIIEDWDEWEENFGDFVCTIREAEAMIGDPFYTLGQDELRMRQYRRSLYVVKEVKKGEMFSEENVRALRPAEGLSPKCLKDIIGKRAACDIEYGSPLSWGLVAKGE